MTGCRCTVLIVGAGPGGSTLATLLARAGVDVVVLDRTTFPRFHIGESLLPCDLGLFARLGVDVTTPAFLWKGGAEFHDEASGRVREYLFRDGLPGTPAHAYQVHRAAFDAQLLDLAVAAGARLHAGTRARDLDVADDGVTVTTESGERYRAEYVVDATGQDAWLARRNRTVDTIKSFGAAAVFGHWEGLADDAWAELTRTGSIRVLMLEGGWGWVIPLSGRTVSIGVVQRGQGITPASLIEHVAASPMLRRLLAGAHPVREPTVFRNFSYRNERSSGPRWSCLGDAGVFLDPVFSSGVSLAMLGAERLADELVPALATGRQADPELVRPASDHMRRAYVTFASLIWSFYNTSIVENLFFAEQPDPEMRAGLITTLAGDVWRNDNLFQDRLLASERRRFDPFAPPA